MNEINGTTLPLSLSDLSGEQVQVVDFKLVHAALGVKVHPSTWISRAIAKYGFVEGEDYTAVSIDPTKMENWPALSGNGGKTGVTTLISLDMAKELAMLDATDIGRSVRKYFILAEKVAVKHAKQELLNAIAQAHKQTQQAKNATALADADCMALAKKQGFNSISLALHSAQKSEDSCKAVMNVNGLKCQSELGRVTLDRIQDALHGADLPAKLRDSLERTFRIYSEEMEKPAPITHPY